MKQKRRPVEKRVQLPFAPPLFLQKNLRRSLGIRSCPVIQSTDDVALCFGSISRLEREVMVAGTVDCKSRLVYWSLLSVGTSEGLAFRVGDAFQGAVRASGSGIFLVHNHPSGSLDPSEEDLELTRTVAAVGELMGYRLLDHVIVVRGGYTSLMPHSVRDLPSGQPLKVASDSNGCRSKTHPGGLAWTR